MVLNVELVASRFRVREKVKNKFHQGKKICVKTIKKAKEVIVQAKSSAVAAITTTNWDTWESVKSALWRAAILALTAAGLYAAYTVYLIFLAARKRNYQIGVVEGLVCYPVTSCQGISFGTAHCSNAGITLQNVIDREYFIGTKEEEDQVHILRAPQLNEIKVLTDQRNIILSAPTKKPFKLSIEETKHIPSAGEMLRFGTIMVPVTNCGDKVSKYLSSVIKHDKKVSLYSYNKGLSSGIKMSYNFVPSSSIEAANTELNLNPPLTAEYFRPNILVSKTDPFDEERWDKIHIGDTVTFKVEKKHICLVEENYSNDEKEWKMEVQPYKSLPKALFLPAYCKLVSVGVVATLLHGGVIHVGDQVYATYK
ncbi:mitochondrial amidoxime reducing component 2-like [Biomphalaria glabrata]|uniref:Mitochondrial amidoxime reducing component 2-like n=1 Tax=Biomphalaria glabrata TaxID=6526 RepID=A0A9W3BCG6_BIOGL|nr:mitochondrial amidoxime reducing component 2-like [Biomphalaria glabrata]